MQAVSRGDAEATCPSFLARLEEGAVAPPVLKELLAWGPSRAVARLVKGNFHAKVIWWRGYGAYAHPAVHFDQFLHYYYSYIRDATGPDEDDERSTGAKVEAAFRANRANPAAALKKVALWWAALPRDCAGEEEFIRTTAPQLRRCLSKDAVRAMQLDDFLAAFTNVNAFRMHARQVKNSEFDLPAGHRESIHERITRLCKKLWSIQSPGGRTVRDVIQFVLWGDTPSDMEQRLWQATRDPAYRLPDFGPSSLGEAVGWARPDDFPPRNNRTNKALRALGHDIKLFSNS